MCRKWANVSAQSSQGCDVAYSLMKPRLKPFQIVEEASLGLLDAPPQNDVLGNAAVRRCAGQPAGRTEDVVRIGHPVAADRGAVGAWNGAVEQAEARLGSFKQDARAAAAALGLLKEHPFATAGAVELPHEAALIESDCLLRQRGRRDWFRQSLGD